MPDDDIGPTVGRYRVLGRLGEGAMGVVVRAYDPTLDREVALKLVRRRGDDPGAASASARLLREGQALARLSHPHVVPIYDVGHSPDGVFVAMHLIEGQSLGAWIRRARPRWKAVVEAYVQAGRGLAAAHGLGLVHRDFKPANVLRGDDGRVRVVDFGLARLRSTSSDTLPSQPRGGLGLLHSQMTAEGAIVGTPLFMSPEQHRGEPATAASDQWALCASLWTGLTGSPPYGGRTVEMLGIEKAGAPPQRPGPPVPGSARLWRALIRGLDPEPARRWSSVTALLDALGERTARRWPWTLGVATGVLGAVGMAARPTTAGPCDGEDGLARVWNTEQRQTLLSHVHQGDGPGSEALAHRVDDWARRWEHARRRACATATPRAESALRDRRIACLRGRADALAALLDVVGGADERATVEQTAGAIGALPDPEQCWDVPRVGWSPSPEVMAAASRIRSALRRVTAAYEMGRLRDALARAEQVVEQAERVDQPPLLAEALERRGLMRRHLDQDEAARADLERAYFMASEHGHVGLAGGVAARLVWIHGNAGDVEAAGTWAEHARAEVSRAGGDGVVLAMVHNALGAMYRRTGDLDAARREFEGSIRTMPDEPQHALSRSTSMINAAQVMV
ncbi:MAG: protein kinase, partial [Deltaproteobacteria bacterium]|nr:protein kinase [Deltaproteobacteria bacterium]